MIAIPYIFLSQKIRRERGRSWLLSDLFPEVLSALPASSSTRISSLWARNALLPRPWCQILQPRCRIMGRRNLLRASQIPITQIRRARTLLPQVNFLTTESLLRTKIVLIQFVRDVRGCTFKTTMTGVFRMTATMTKSWQSWDHLLRKLRSGRACRELCRTPFPDPPIRSGNGIAKSHANSKPDSTWENSLTRACRMLFSTAERITSGPRKQA